MAKQYDKSETVFEVSGNAWVGFGAMGEFPRCSPDSLPAQLQPTKPGWYYRVFPADGVRTAANRVSSRSTWRRQTYVHSGRSPS